MNGRHDDQLLYLPSPHPEPDLRLHLDENISGSVAKLLRTCGFDVTTTNDVGLRAKSDTTHMTYALQQQRVIVTRDRDFLELHDQDHAHSGIIYWPHTEVLSGNAMQELLVGFLQRVAAAPSDPARLSTVLQPPPRKKKRKKRRSTGSNPVAPLSNKLPAGLRVHGRVRAIDGPAYEVRLDAGQTAWLLSSRLAQPALEVGEEVDAVTLPYLRACKRLHLSQRRVFATARTFPISGLRQLRRGDYQLVRELEQQWPVEIVFEDDHVVRIYGVTSESVREVTSYLHRLMPWTGSAVVEVDRVAFKTWVATAYGDLTKMGQAIGGSLSFQHQDLLVVCAESNRELNAILTLIHAHHPQMQICQVQSARFEPLLKCQWACLHPCNNAVAL